MALAKMGYNIRTFPLTFVLILDMFKLTAAPRAHRFGLFEKTKSLVLFMVGKLNSKILF
jgi:hypothetical protein